MATNAQLRGRKVSGSAITRAVDSQRLHEVYWGVYSVIPPALLTPEGWMAAAILAGGDGARLCSHSGAHRAELTRRPPPVIHVATKHRRTEVDWIRWHRLPLSANDVTRIGRIPVTTPALIPSEIAQDLSLWDLKGVLAELEYHYDIDASSVIVVPSRAGVAKLRRAIAEHTPQLAATRSELERAFIRFLVERGFVLPKFNHREGVSTVDAVYEELGLIIELDGVRGHKGDRRLLRDHRRDLHRRSDGFHVVRYAFAQLTTDADLIEAELERLGVPRAVSCGT